MKKKNVTKTKLKKTVVSNLDKAKGGLGWISLPHTDCNCWAASADKAWSNVGC